MTPLNFNHLHYFWVVAREGSMTRAAERLGVAVQTVSGQLALFERALGKALFAGQGRGLALTEAGRTALGYADQIFELADGLRDQLAQPDGPQRLRLRAGISDGLPKLLASRLLASVLDRPEGVRLICHEGEFDDLVADLALHRLDVVLTDRPAPAGGSLRVFSKRLGDFAVGLFATPALAGRYREGFPASLQGAPLLLPTRHHVLRGHIDRWLESAGVHPEVVGEFEDDALLATFGRSGMGIFPAPHALAAQVDEQLGAERVGPMAGVSQQIYAISSERRLGNPAVEALCATSLSFGPAGGALGAG